jgi:hypothetical protein
MAAGAIALLITICIIFGVAWAICYVLATFAKDVPPQVQKFIWLIAALIVIYKLIIFAGVI